MDNRKALNLYLPPDIIKTVKEDAKAEGLSASRHVERLVVKHHNERKDVK